MAGAIPLLRPLRESLAGDSVRRVLGIVNGTTNYVLDKMDTTGAGLRRGGRAGAGPRATPRPTRPPTSRASTPPPRRRSWPRWPSTPGWPRPTCTARASPRSPRRRRRGARAMGCVVKLLAICERVSLSPDERRCAEKGFRSACIPAMIPRSHPLAGVREAFNAVFVEARRGRAADVLRQGRRRRPDRQRGPRRPGRGRPATASSGGRGPGESSYADLPVLPMGQAVTRYHISLDVADRPGVLAQVASAFAEHEVSIETVRQQLVPGDDDSTAGPRSSSSPTPHRTPPCPRPSSRWPSSTSWRPWSASCGWRGTEDVAQPVARGDRGVPPTACPSSTDVPSRHAGRGRHAARPGPPPLRSSPAARSG